MTKRLHSAAPPALDTDPGQPPADHKRGSADARVDRNGPDWAVDPAGAALHAAVTVFNDGFVVLVGKYSVRADAGTGSAADAQTLVELETCHTRYVS